MALYWIAQTVPLQSTRWLPELKIGKTLLHKNDFCVPHDLFVNPFLIGRQTEQPGVCTLYCLPFH